MKLNSLSDLEQLLSEKEKKKSAPAPGSSKKSHDGKGASVLVRLETAGRKGKSVTIISGLQHNPDTMNDIARILKQHCGAGGTVKGKEIEIQGDQRNSVIKKMESMGYSVR